VSGHLRAGYGARPTTLTGPPVICGFSLRSPVRPNPIASSIVDLIGIDGNVLQVRGLDCVDGTPLLDLKPEHGAHE